MYRSIFSYLSLALVLVAVEAGAQQPGRPQQTAAPSQAAGTQAVGTQAQMQAGQQQAAAQNGQRQIPIVKAQDAIQDGLARAAQQPFPDLTAEEQAYVDQVLNVWEQRTAKVNQYSCDLNRWQFDPTRFAEGHLTVATGTLKFQDPGKGEVNIAKVESLAEKGPPAQYRVNPREPHGEHWICDGEWVHILDHNNKKATRIQLPPAMRGKAIDRSPLPFVFGVKAADMKRRYWIRPLSRPDRPNETWLEVFPKSANDAGNYSRLHVALDNSDILPSVLVVFMPNWTPQQQHREIYQFSNRQVDGFLNAVKQKIFMQSFIPTKLGSDWNVVEEPYIPPQEVAGQGQGSPALTSGAQQQPQGANARVANPRGANSQGQPAVR